MNIAIFTMLGSILAMWVVLVYEPRYRRNKIRKFHRDLVQKHKTPGILPEPTFVRALRDQHLQERAVDAYDNLYTPRFLALKALIAFTGLASFGVILNKLWSLLR